MSGILTNGLPQNAPFTGLEQLNLDTQLAQGASPQSTMSNLMQLATANRWLTASADLTPTAGSRYYGSYNIGAPCLLTGIAVLIGGTGGTDSWIAELHGPTGLLLATSATAGTTAGTANTWQRLAFTTPFEINEGQAGTYYIALQSNGNTAKPAVYTSAGLPIVSGSAAGVFGTGAAITPPTTYTASLAPVAQPY